MIWPTLTRDRLRTLQDELKPGAPYALTGLNTLETVVTLYALLEQRVPVLLLHPRLDADRARGRSRGRDAGTICPARPDAAAILYTSGTTGRPRGAVLTRSALVASAQASAANLGWLDDDCWLLAMPIGRIGGLSIVTRCLAARKPVALEPAFDAATLPARIDATRSTLVSLVPTMLAQVFDAHPDWVAPAHLRAVLVGGAAAPAGLLQRAAERRLPIVITYGCTETCSQIVATPYSTSLRGAACGAGRPLPGVELRITWRAHRGARPDADGGLPRRAALAGCGLVRYRGSRETRRTRRFRIHARRADLVVTGGENVYPAEVEHALEKCPGIREAGVFGVQDEIWGQTVAAALVTTQAPPSDATLL